MTKQSTYLFALVFLLTTTNLSAQEDFGFDISKYQTPDISRKGLSVEIKTKNDFEYYSDLSNDTAKWKVRTYNTNNNLNIGFWMYKNTRKKISTLSIGTQTNIYAKGGRRIDISSKNSSLDNSLYLPISWENKFFVQPKLFLIYDAATKSYFERKKSTSLNELGHLSDNKSLNLNLNLNVSIGVGFGRMEDVTDARQAIYILDALKENNVLNHKIDAIKIDEFAKVISTVKNKRFLDARLHKIEELTVVDKFLRTNKLLESSDISYFTALNDMWEFGDLFERKSGYELSLKNIFGNEWIRNEVLENQPNYLLDYYTTDYAFSDKIALSFDYSKPIKLNWQHDFNSNLTADFIREYKYHSMLDKKTTNKPPMILSVNAEYNFGYYPNTRTNIYTKLLAGYLPLAYKSETEQRVDSQLYFGANFGAYYYFSPNLRLATKAYIGNNTYLHLNKITDYKNVGNSFRSGFDITFTYLFF